MPPIYLDYNATTPVDPRVLEAALPFFCEQFGNAASRTHAFGRSADNAVAAAKDSIAALVGAHSSEIVFTSGATESNNLAIKGIACARRDKGKHIITQAAEHKSVLDTCKRLAAEGYDVTVLQPSAKGRITPDQVQEAIRPETILVSLMYGNNEVGTLLPIPEIGGICRERGVPLHTDATQAIGKHPVNVEMDSIDLLSFTGHKIYGMKGCGALYVRKQGANPVNLTCQIDGGGHQDGHRSGTLNVPGIVALGAACRCILSDMGADIAAWRALRDHLEKSILRELPDTKVNGDTIRRLPHVTNLSFAGVDGHELLAGFVEIAVSGGSACTSASAEPSHVLTAMGVPRELALAAVRYSLGRGTTREHVDKAIEQTVTHVRHLRARG